MANFTFNTALGKAREYNDRIANNDPANSALIIVAIVTTEADATLKDLDTLAAVLANGNTAEATNTNYARIVLTDADLSPSVPDDGNDSVDLDFADPVFNSIAAGDNWTDLLFCYDPDTTSGDDTQIIPIDQFDFNVTPAGGNITVNLNAVGWHRFS